MNEKQFCDYNEMVENICGNVCRPCKRRCISVPCTPTPACPPCPPCRPTRPVTRPNIQQHLFSDIGLPEPLGQPVFLNSETPPLAEIIKVNDNYEEDAEIWFSKPLLEEPPAEEPVPTDRQLTPEYSKYSKSETQMMNDLTAHSQAEPANNSQGFDGWLTNAYNKPEVIWDGVPLDPTGLSGSEICPFIRPTGSSYVILGLKQHYDNIKPFADETSPTISEINNWSIEVIRHFRALLGNNNPVVPDARLFLEARWATERKRSTVWDADYPDVGGTYDGPWGPCQGGTNEHCGESFFPEESDRLLYINAAPYNGDYAKYPELQDYTLRMAKASGISGWAGSDLPWSIKIATVIGHWICNEGTIQHAGPYVGKSTDGTSRKYFGCSWWWDGSSNTVSFRGKWR